MTYINSMPETCKKCFHADRCEICVDDRPSSCKICKPGWFMQGGKCEDSCPLGTHPNQKGQCIDCTDFNCEECDHTNSSQCIRCNSTTFLERGGICV